MIEWCLLQEPEYELHPTFRGRKKSVVNMEADNHSLRVDDLDINSDVLIECFEAEFL